LLALLGAHHILHVSRIRVKGHFNPLNAELNPICHLLALLAAHHILHVSRIRVKGHFNPLNAQLNPICHLLALLGAHHILHISRIKVNLIRLCVKTANIGGNLPLDRRMASHYTLGYPRAVISGRSWACTGPLYLCCQM